MHPVLSGLILPIFIETGNRPLFLNQVLDAHVSSTIVRASRTEMGVRATKRHGSYQLMVISGTHALRAVCSAGLITDNKQRLTGTAPKIRGKHLIRKRFYE